MQELTSSRRTVGIAGLGAIGLPVAKALDMDPGKLELIAVAASDVLRAQQKIVDFRSPPRVVAPPDLAEAEIVVEAAPAAAFDAIVLPAIDKGRIVIVASAGALLARPHFIERAKGTGARILVPSGALAGLDAVRALAPKLISVILETRKRPQGLAGAPYLERKGIDLGKITEATCVFRGDAAQAAIGFPANANVAAALAFAGVGPHRTQVEIWADPSVTRNTHTISIEADAATIAIRVESSPSAENPRTSQLAQLSVLACLRGLETTLRAGT